MAEYLWRVVDQELDELSGGLAAIALEGPRGVGKTVTGRRRAATRFDLDDPDARELLAADVHQLDEAPRPILIDEWQRYPRVWDYVRRRVDDGAAPGSFLLAGSAPPVEAPTHSGAGRIVQVRMRPMSLAERAIEGPSVGLADLLTGRRSAISGTTAIGLRDYVSEILASGLPAIRPLTPRNRRAQLEGYLSRVVERDFVEYGQQVRRPEVLRAWLAAYAAASATTATYGAILDAATSGESDKPAKTTTTAYRDVLAQLWLLDPVPGWLPGRGHLTRLTQAPKHHLADPALAAHLLGMEAEALLSGEATGPPVPRDGTFLGALFESLVTLSARVYAQANEASVRHLRTKDGRQEVDLIIERRDQRVVALEVKLASTPEEADLRHLHWLRDRMGDDLLDAAIITTGKYAYRRKDGIAVIPAALLGP